VDHFKHGARAYNNTKEGTTVKDSESDDRSLLCPRQTTWCNHDQPLVLVSGGSRPVLPYLDLPLMPKMMSLKAACGSLVVFVTLRSNCCL